MSGIKVIFFDAYGTFLSTGTGSVDAAARILSANGVHIDPAAFYARWKQLHRQAVRAGRFTPEREIFADDLRRLYEEYGIAGDYRADVTIMLDSLLGRRAYPEAGEVISLLSERYRLFIASNTDTPPLMENLDLNGLLPFFEGIYTSESLGCYKPSPEFYRAMLADVGCSPEEALFVGDSPEEDVIAPGNVGMATMFLDRRGSGANHGQTFTSDDLTGLLQIF